MSEDFLPGEWTWVANETGWVTVGWRPPERLAQAWRIWFTLDADAGFSDEPFAERLVKLLNEAAFAPTAREMGDLPPAESAPSEDSRAD